MKRKLFNETSGEIALDYIARAIAVLEGESPKHAKSFVITVSGDGDDYIIDMFQYDDSLTSDAVREHLEEETCDDQTEHIKIDN